MNLPRDTDTKDLQALKSEREDRSAKSIHTAGAESPHPSAGLRRR